MLKFYQRIQMNTTNHFNDVLPATTMEWRGGKIFSEQQKILKIFFLSKSTNSIYDRCM